MQTLSGYHTGMNWSTRFQSHPQFGQAVRFATGRPPWVLKATGVVAVLAFAVPLIALVLLIIPAILLTAVAWTVFGFIARIIDAVAGQGHADQDASPTPDPDGRENVRVINRP